MQGLEITDWHPSGLKKYHQSSIKVPVYVRLGIIQDSYERNMLTHLVVRNVEFLHGLAELHLRGVCGDIFQHQRTLKTLVTWTALGSG